MGLVAMLTIASALNCSEEEIKFIAKEKNDDHIWRLFVRGEITQEEDSLLKDYRQLDLNQKRVLNLMIKEMLK